MKRRFLRPVLALLALSVCLSGSIAAQPSPYVIHVITALTGPGANLGQDEVVGLRAFEKFANRTGGLRGTPIHFEVSDDQTQPAVAVQLLTQIQQSHPAVVLGSALATQSLAMAALVSKGPVLYALTPNMKPEADSYVFAAAPTATDLMGVVFSYFRGRGVTKLATLVLNDVSGKNAVDALEKLAALPENKDVKFVEHETIVVGDINANAQAAKIKASGAQAVFAMPNGTPFGTALHGLNDVGLDIPVYTGAANFSPQLLDQYKNFLPKDLLTSGPSFFNKNRAASDPLKKPIDDFYAALAGENVTAPNLEHSFAWDAATITLAALRAIGPQATATQVKEYIERVRNLPAASGVYNFSRTDHQGLSGTSALLMLRSDPAKPGQVLIVSKQGGAPL